jgi:hypothetical protein
MIPIKDVAFCSAFAVGPLLTGDLVESIGFPNTLEFFALCLLVCSPLLMALRGNLGKPDTTPYEQMPSPYLEQSPRESTTLVILKLHL